MRSEAVINGWLNEMFCLTNKMGLLLLKIQNKDNWSWRSALILLHLTDDLLWDSYCCALKQGSKLNTFCNTQLRRWMTFFKFSVWWSASGEVISGGGAVFEETQSFLSSVLIVCYSSLCKCERVTAWYRQIQRAHLSPLISYLPLSSLSASPGSTLLSFRASQRNKKLGTTNTSCHILDTLWTDCWALLASSPLRSNMTHQDRSVVLFSSMFQSCCRYHRNVQASDPSAVRSEQKFNCIQCFSSFHLQSRAPTGIKSSCLTAGKKKTPSAVCWWFLLMCRNVKVLPVQTTTWHQNKTLLTSVQDQGRVHILSWWTNTGFLCCIAASVDVYSYISKLNSPVCWAHGGRHEHTTTEVTNQTTVSFNDCHSVMKCLNLV